MPKTTEPFEAKDLLPEIRPLGKVMREELPAPDLLTPAMLQAQVKLPMLQPVLMNSYRRSYYISRDYRFRLTIDRDLQFQGLDRYRSFKRGWQEDPAVIVEAKYDFVHDQNYDEVGQYLPFRVGKNSKYVTGMLMVGQV